MKNQELLNNIKQFLDDEHLSKSTEQYAANDPRLVEAALELANNSKSILGGLYYDFRKPNDGFLRKTKNKIVGKIANIVRNTLERPLLTQQKFNEQTYYLLNLLLEENKQLKKQLDRSEKGAND